MYSIVLVDDHAIVREGFKRLIEMESDLDVVAECRSADDAVEAVSHWRPDLVALDLSLPDGSGLPLDRAPAQRPRADAYRGVEHA